MKSVYLQIILIWSVHKRSFVNLEDYNRTSRIIGGDSASIQNYPFTASLVKKTFFNDRFGGGAAIIHRYWAATAAHCAGLIRFLDIFLRLAVVRSNTSFWQENYIEHTIVRVIIHRRYNGLTADFDMALVKVENGFFGTYEKPTLLPSRNYEYFAGTQATVLGWGTMDPAIMKFSHELRFVNIYLGDRGRCKRAYSLKVQTFTARMICAGAPGKDACINDSGGPLVQNGVLIGIVSWGPTPCANPNLPGIYTNVLYFTSWIKNRIP